MLFLSIYYKIHIFYSTWMNEWMSVCGTCTHTLYVSVLHTRMRRNSPQRKGKCGDDDAFDWFSYICMYTVRIFWGVHGTHMLNQINNIHTGLIPLFSSLHFTSWTLKRYISDAQVGVDLKAFYGWSRSVYNSF